MNVHIRVKNLPMLGASYGRRLFAPIPVNLNGISSDAKCYLILQTVLTFWSNKAIICTGFVTALKIYTFRTIYSKHAPNPRAASPYGVRVRETTCSRTNVVYYCTQIKEDTSYVLRNMNIDCIYIL